MKKSLSPGQVFERLRYADLSYLSHRVCSPLVEKRVSGEILQARVSALWVRPNRR